jgi:putative flippase GtrA
METLVTSLRLSDLRTRLLKDDGLFWQFMRFATVGGFATLLHYSVLIALVELGGLSPLAGTSVGYVCGGLFSYAMNYYFTFDSDGHHGKTLAKFVIVVAAGFFINGFILQTLISSLAMNYLLAQAIATILVLIWNFSCSRFWAFR